MSRPWWLAIVNALWSCAQFKGAAHPRQTAWIWTFLPEIYFPPRQSYAKMLCITRLRSYFFGKPQFLEPLRVNDAQKVCAITRNNDHNNHNTQYRPMSLWYPCPWEGQRLVILGADQRSLSGNEIVLLTGVGEIIFKWNKSPSYTKGQSIYYLQGQQRGKYPEQQTQPHPFPRKDFKNTSKLNYKLWTVNRLLPGYFCWWSRRLCNQYTIRVLKMEQKSNSPL